MTNEDAIDNLSVLWERMRESHGGNAFVADVSIESLDMAIEALKPKPVSYQDCADAIMMMWMEKIITDSQYNKIMGRLNKWRWGKDDE